MEKDYINLGKPMPDYMKNMIGENEEDNDGDDDSLDYPTVYLSDIKGLENLPLTEGPQKMMVLVEVESRTITEDNDGEKTCSIELQIQGIKPMEISPSDKMTVSDKDMETRNVMDAFMKDYTLTKN